MKLRVFIILTLSAICGCGNLDVRICDTQQGYIVLQKHNDTLHTLLHIINGDTVSTWPLEYGVYRTDYGDVQGNGENEVMVGVIKATKYWHSVDKRLFIFKIYGGRHIRPLWLGSRVGCRLEDFEVVRDSLPAMIKTTETNADSTFHAIYRLGGFGLRFVKYDK